MEGVKEGKVKSKIRRGRRREGRDCKKGIS
jgi:hypothetical protein